MGLTSSGDVFYDSTDKALAGIPGVHKLVLVRNLWDACSQSWKPA